MKNVPPAEQIAQAVARGRDMLTRQMMERERVARQLAAHDAVMCEMILQIIEPVATVKARHVRRVQS